MVVSGSRIQGSNVSRSEKGVERLDRIKMKDKGSSEEMRRGYQGQG